MPKDGWAIGILVLLTLAAAWQLSYFDAWLEQLDISNAFLPWCAYLGQRLREGQIPGWMPYQSSGAPFAGDPQSGWMYLPAMLLFPFFAPALAFKLLLGLELLIAGLTTYAFARVMRLGMLGSLIAAIVFELHPFANSPTYCCTNRIQIWTWLPMLLLGTELALRAVRWRERVLPWCLAALALSQMYAGWFGQGVMYALLVYGSFLAYRTLASGTVASRRLADRLAVSLASGVAPIVISIALGAAGLFPRLAVNRETLIAQGHYDALTGAQTVLPTLKSLVLNIAGSDNAPRGVAVGGVAFVLLFLAPVLACGGKGTLYFAGLTIGSYVLMLADSPLHHALALIPYFGAIHNHNTINVSAIGAIGPAMLAGAAIDALPTCVLRSWRRGLVAVPLALLTATLFFLGPHGLRDAGLVQIAAILTTVGVLVAVSGSGQWARAMPVLLVALAFAVPSGAEFVSAQLGHPLPSPWRINQTFDPARMQVTRAATATSAPGTAGQFLQEHMAAGGPFRFAGYTTIAPPTPNALPWSWYIGARANPYVQAILSNARAIPLRLNDVSSYNPSQLARYAEFINFINGAPENYHVTYVYPPAMTNKLFVLLNVRYLLLDRRLKPNVDNPGSVAHGRHLVFQDRWVSVYESNEPLREAWIVHDVAVEPKASVLAAIGEPAFDPLTMAVIEGAPPPLAPAPASAAEQAVVTLYAPEKICIQATAVSDGLLVISEPYEVGWHAYVDGRPAALLPVDYAFRGVQLSAGTHFVELRYEPESLTIGLWTSLAAAILIAMVIAWRGWARFRDPGPSR